MPTSFMPIFAITRQRTGGLKQRGQLGQITKKRSRRGGAEAVCIGTPGWGPWGEGRSVEVLALGRELAAIFLDLRRLRIKQLRLRLRADSLGQQLRPRIADSLSQQFAQLSLCLRRFTREGFVSYVHERHVGVPEGELNPRSILYLSSDFASLAKRYG